jgi:hypothetical protein
MSIFIIRLLRLRGFAICRPFEIQCITVECAGRVRAITTIIIVNKLRMKIHRTLLPHLRSELSELQEAAVDTLKVLYFTSLNCAMKAFIFVPIWFQNIYSNTNLNSLVNI